MKDVVSERSTYYPQDAIPLPVHSLESAASSSELLDIPSSSPPSYPPVPGTVPLLPGMKPTQFNLPRFIPLLSERIHTLAPFTRMFLVQWISVLDSVPDLELIAHLPDFLDGLFNYLSDPNVDVRVATLNVLGEFLKEIRDVVEIQRERGILKIRGKESSRDAFDGASSLRADRETLEVAAASPPAYPQPTIVEENEEGTLVRPGSGLGARDTVTGLAEDISQLSVEPPISDIGSPQTQPSTGSLPYVPGQNVVLDIGRMTEILGPHLLSTGKGHTFVGENTAVSDG